MPNFKVRDQLKVTGGIWFRKGETVTVRKVDPEDDDHTYLCSNGKSTLWVRNEDVEPISKFAVRQIYKVGKINDGRTGNIIKIIGIDSDPCRPILFKTIRGEDCCSRFAENSVLANALTILTGKQIGEAIKDFDEKKTGGVREVKRKARVGEYIKVIDASVTRDYNYSNGDILKCTFVGSCGIQAELGVKYGTLVDHEYVVLEGYKPDSEKQSTEEKLKAKVGDTIRALCDNGGPVIAGSVWKVEEVDSLGTLGVRNKKNGGGFAVSSTNYVVISSGKHIWTPEEVAKAKTIVLDTIRELAEKRKYVLFSHVVPSSDDCSGFYAYVTGGDDCHFGIIEQKESPYYGAFMSDKTERAGSKCSDTDEPNEWIGKCVALYKVLHKPIPSFIMGD